MSELNSVNQSRGVAQTSKSAVSRVSKPANGTPSNAQPTWKSAVQQVWKPALRASSLHDLLTIIIVLLFVFVTRTSSAADKTFLLGGNSIRLQDVSSEV